MDFRYSNLEQCGVDGKLYGSLERERLMERDQCKGCCMEGAGS